MIRTLLGMALFAFCWVVIGYAVFQLLQVGTCASGGPYVSARVCPDGTERLMLALVGGIFGLFAAFAVYAGRGAPPGSDRKPQVAGAIVWLWTGIFWSLAISCFLAVWGPEANPGPGGKTGGLIVGFMGLVMGAGGLFLIDFRGRRDPQRLRPAVARMVGTASRFSATGGPVERLDTLDRLRRQGALTDAEFETLKANIMRGS